jgi:hypothetical protein
MQKRENIVKNNKKYKIISNHLGIPIEVAEVSMGALPVLQMKYDENGSEKFRNKAGNALNRLKKIQIKKNSVLRIGKRYEKCFKKN